MVTNRRLKDLSGPDFYDTPGKVTLALLEVEKFQGFIWEPACGDGAISKILAQTGYDDVESSDLFDHGYGRSGVDFLRITDLPVSNIITNPPFKLAEQFVETGLRLTTHKLALLLRLSFLESQRRYKNIYSITPPARVHVFSARPTFYPKGAERKGSGTIAYAWFVWDKSYTGPPTINWLKP